MPYQYNPGYAYRVTQPFGLNPRNGLFHPGVDYAAPVGTPIPAASSGVVVYSGMNGGPGVGFGNVVVVESIGGDGQPYYTLYAHQNGQEMATVGQTVAQAQIIGQVGLTGNTNGPHLHFEVEGPNQTVNNANGGSMGFSDVINNAPNINTLNPQNFTDWGDGGTPFGYQIVPGSSPPNSNGIEYGDIADPTSLARNSTDTPLLSDAETLVGSNVQDVLTGLNPSGAVTITDLSSLSGSLLSETATLSGGKFATIGNAPLVVNGSSNQVASNGGNATLQNGGGYVYSGSAGASVVTGDYTNGSCSGVGIVVSTGRTSSWTGSGGGLRGRRPALLLEPGAWVSRQPPVRDPGEEARGLRGRGAPCCRNGGGVAVDCSGRALADGRGPKWAGGMRP